MSFIAQHMKEVAEIASKIDTDTLEKMVRVLAEVRKQGGRLFILGVGGSAGNASHAVNDFRKLCGLETYAPTDNVSELTARTNDEGWESVFVGWLRVSRLTSKDAVLVFSVGGGDAKKNVSANLVAALKYAQECDATILGVVGRATGYTAEVADVCCVVPSPNPQMVTPHAEAFQAVVWHAIVSHPAMKQVETKWESLEKRAA